MTTDTDLEVHDMSSIGSVHTRIDVLRDEGLDGAECLYDPELHDGPATQESAEAQAIRKEIAKQVCASCPVLAACELYTERVRPDSGVWAGRTAVERLLGVRYGCAWDERPSVDDLVTQGRHDVSREGATPLSRHLSRRCDKPLTCNSLPQPPPAPPATVTEAS